MRLASADLACARTVRPDGDCRLDQLVLGELGRDHDEAVLTHARASDARVRVARPSPKVAQKKRRIGSACHAAGAASCRHTAATPSTAAAGNCVPDDELREGSPDGLHPSSDRDTGLSNLWRHFVPQCRFISDTDIERPCDLYTGSTRRGRSSTSRNGRKRIPTSPSTRSLRRCRTRASRPSASGTRERLPWWSDGRDEHKLDLHL